MRSQLQSSTQLRLGVPEPHGAVGRSEGGGERATKGRGEGQNPGGGKEEQCREGVRCEIACGRSGRLAAQLTCAVSCWTVIYSLILSIRSALNRGLTGLNLQGRELVFLKRQVELGSADGGAFHVGRRGVKGRRTKWTVFCEHVNSNDYYNYE